MQWQFCRHTINAFERMNKGTKTTNEMYRRETKNSVWEKISPKK